MRRFELVEGTSSKFWKIAVDDTAVELQWGRIGTKGQAKTKAFATARDAATRAEKLVASKLKAGYREVKAVTHSARAKAEHNPEVTALIYELRALGAEVETFDGNTTEAELKRAEKALGFPLPSEVREFFLHVGQVMITLDRTWNFYGLAEALRVTKQYRREFSRGSVEPTEDGVDGNYYPNRFLVLHDQGDYSNAASGTVYDADLDGFLHTDGSRWIERADAIHVGYWEYLVGELREIKRRIADPDDILVSGGTRDIARKRKAKDDGARAPAASSRRDAIEKLYATFAKHTPEPGKRFCFQGKGCGDCRRFHAACAKTSLCELSHDDLFHYAYCMKLDTALKRADYKHFTPRIVELLDELSWHGNPSIVIARLLSQVRDASPSRDEDAAVEIALRDHWEWLLRNPATTTQTLNAYLESFALSRDDVTPFLDAWTASWAQEGPLAHAAAFVTGHEFDVGAKYYGWPEAAFRKLRSWMLSTPLKAALQRANKYPDVLGVLEDARSPMKRRAMTRGIISPALALRTKNMLMNLSPREEAILRERFGVPDRGRKLKGLQPRHRGKS